MPKILASASGNRSRRRWRQRRAGYPGLTERRRCSAFRVRPWSPGSARSASTSTSSSRSSGSANAEHLRPARAIAGCHRCVRQWLADCSATVHADDRSLRRRRSLSCPCGPSARGRADPRIAEGGGRREAPGATHLNNTGAYIHRMPPSAVNTAAAGAARTVRAQVLAPPGVLQRAGQKQLVAEITRIVSKVSGDPTQAGRTWVLLTEAPEGGWGLAGTAFGKEEFAALAARAKAKP